MIAWAGRIFTVLGAAHLLLGLALLAPSHARTWFTGGLWMPEGTLAQMGPASGAFWMTFGSFGAPLLVLGLTVLWLRRKGITPPAFIGWTVGAWSVAAGLVFEPAPWIAVTVAAGLLVAGTRRAARTPSPAPQ
ncbi:DUF6463 family protein [Glycomyces paridis]|uniref:Uncharacterized protein n=1 Tax=Glycomyces paridis TaxID=2126555 RepID=A0A4S8P957_9ACTN|nr:DUF6463 family protein [Glycomyces paridis]THV26770.1 hypothetical protein E9998_17445 [Glycomyces paridis]